MSDASCSPASARTWLVCLSLLAGVSVASADRSVGAPTGLVGEAFARDGTLRYREHHEFATLPGGSRQLTIYRDATGREIGRMEADYSAYRFAPTYRMIDHRHDSEDLVRREGDVVHLEHRVGTTVRRRTVRLTRGRELIIGPGFNEFIRAHWDDLLAGRTLTCDFAIPSRLQVVAFRIRHAPERQSRDGMRFTVSVDNPLLRLLAPSLHVEYHRLTRELLSYEGPSNVNDDRNRAQEVVIRFPGARTDTFELVRGSAR